MAWLDNYPNIQAIFGSFSGLHPKTPPTSGEGWEERHHISAHHRQFTTIFNISYDGEKDEGAIGPIKTYWLNHIALRARSWQSYIDSDITQGIINKYCGWIIGGGLKLQSEPVKLVLESEGININKEEFSKNVEARFSLFAKSMRVSHDGLENLNQLAATCKRNAVLAGDVLVVLRLINNQITVQLIDAGNVQQPIFNSDLHAKAEARGNRIRHGVELSKKGEHVAYYVRKTFDVFTRILAKNRGRKTAYLVYGLKWRIDNTRGVPLTSSIMQKIATVDKYSDATLQSAEERAKIVYSIEHAAFSTGESPLLNLMKASHDADAKTDTGEIHGEAVAQKVASTTKKQAFNMPRGAVLKSLEAKNELYYKEFYNTNTNAIASAIGIPPEVAYSLYNSNFSASRAALKDWEHTIMVKRGDFSTQFYQPIYDLWLEIDILLGKTQAPGFLMANARKDFMTLDAFRNARWVGSNVPHIDPVKEVLAERLKLGSGGAHLPLTTGESATEALNGGDFDTNLAQMILEFLASEELKPAESEHEDDEDPEDK